MSWAVRGGEHREGARAPAAQLPPPPPCLTNVVVLCELQDLAVRVFSVAAKDAAVQAHKWALLRAGVASCWRAQAASAAPDADGAASASGGATLSESPQPKAAVHSRGAAGSSVSRKVAYQVWAFGTPELLDQLTRAAPDGKGAPGGEGEYGIRVHAHTRARAHTHTLKQRQEVWVCPTRAHHTKHTHTHTHTHTQGGWVCGSS